jgi:hypothetical protein
MRQLKFDKEKMTFLELTTEESRDLLAWARAVMYEGSVDLKNPFFTQWCARFNVRETQMFAALISVFLPRALESCCNSSSGSADPKLKNFSIVEHKDSVVNAYSRGCLGSIATKADLMITVGSTISVLDGRNEKTEIQTMTHVDIFMTQDQGEAFHKKLGKALSDNREAT